MNLGPFFTLPNGMSLLRIALVPFVGAALAAADPVASRPRVILLLVLAFLTDWFDGRIARWTGRQSEWGRILDPLADKIFVSGVAIFLVLHRGFPLWALLLIAGRDLGIVVLGAWLARRRSGVPAPNMAGKIAMCVFSLTLFAYAMPITAAREPLLWISIAFVFLSTALYLRDFSRGSVGMSRGAGVAAH